MDSHMAFCARCGASSMVGAGLDAEGDVVVPPFQVRLTKQEVRAFRLVQSGLSNKQIANLLSVSDNTVKFHLKNIYEKLGVGSRRRVPVNSISGRSQHELLGHEQTNETESSSCSYL